MNELFENIIDCFLNSKQYRDYLIKNMTNVHNDYIQNCINRLKEKDFEDGKLKIIIGEATQNHGNFIYGSNKSKLKNNTFLKPSIVLEKKIKESNVDWVNEYHDKLASELICVIDVWPIPLPSEIYRNINFSVVLNDFLTQIIDFKIEEIISLSKEKSINNIIVQNRYDINAVTDQVNKIITKLKNALPEKTSIIKNPDSLSNGAGNLDKLKWDNFIKL